MKLTIITRGDYNNPKLWSGTPVNLKKHFSQIPHCELNFLNYNLPRIFGSIVARLFKKYEFVIGGSRDPWFCKLFENKTKQVLKNNQSDVVLFICDFNIPEKLNNYSRMAVYVDSHIEKYFPYLQGKVFWRKAYERFFIHKDSIYLGRCDFIFTQNEWSKQAYIEETKVDKNKIFNVGFGVNLQPYNGPKDYSQKNLLIVLRRGTEEYKGLNLLLDAFEILHTKDSDVKLAVVGTTSREIKGVTYYEGFPREKTVELFQQSSLYVMPALREPNGITYLEALANRTPIVGLNRFALPEFSGNGKWGFMIENEDSEELADVLDKALSNPERLEAMGKLGQKFVEERYNWEIVCQKMYEIMQGSNIKK